MAYTEETPVPLLLSPAAPRPPRRQLRLQPVSMFLDRSRALAVEAEAPPATSRRARPRDDAAFQMRMPLPAAPAGKGKSMGTAPLSRAEKAVQKRSPGLRLLPKTRGACLAARATKPATGERLPKGDRGRRHAPCPFVSCRHHLYLDVNPESGAIKINFPGLERMELAGPWPARPVRVTVETGSRTAPGRRESLVFYGPPRQHAVLDLHLMEDTCSVDVGDRGERRRAAGAKNTGKLDLAIVGRKMRLTMERARQLLVHAQDEAEAKATDGQVVRPLEGDDPNDGAGDE